MPEASWESLAPGWERWGDHLDRAYAPVRSWMLGALDLRPHDTLLELAAGTGSAGLAAVTALDHRVRLVASDLAPSMIAVAHRRARALGLLDAGFAVMDATRVGVASGSVDRVLCESGFMLVPDPARALDEARRVLRPGGRLVFSVWGAARDNPWDALAADLLVQLGHREPATAVPMADADHTLALVRRAGFSDVRLAEVPVRFAWADLAEWEQWSLATDTTADVIRGLSDGARAEFRERIAAAFAPYRRGRAVELPGLALCVEAARPARASEDRQ